jgi:ATP-dependent DNA helicase RecQ
MSMEEIARQRNLSMGTIEGHLAVFVSLGDLDIQKVIPPRKLEKILEVVKATGQVNALRPLKDLLGDDYSYGEIKLALEHYRNSQ